MHYLIKTAFRELYPQREINFDGVLKYSKAFKGYNANVRHRTEYVEFRLSYEWKGVSEEIVIGLLQELFNKIYKTHIKTVNIDLYHLFLKKVPEFKPKTQSDPMLLESFHRVNKEYFHEMMDLSNLEWGNKNFRTLGTYTYGTDTVRISTVLKHDLHLLDFVMYHELLHKKFKFKQQGKRTIHHSKEFREWEKRFKDPDIEDKLKRFVRKKRLMNTFSFF